MMKKFKIFMFLCFYLFFISKAYAEIDPSRAYECSIESCDTFSQLVGIGYYGIAIVVGLAVATLSFSSSIGSISTISESSLGSSVENVLINLSTGSITSIIP